MTVGYLETDNADANAPSSSTGVLKPNSFANADATGGDSCSSTNLRRTLGFERLKPAIIGSSQRHGGHQLAPKSKMVNRGGSGNSVHPVPSARATVFGNDAVSFPKSRPTNQCHSKKKMTAPISTVSKNLWRADMLLNCYTTGPRTLQGIGSAYKRARKLHF